MISFSAALVELRITRRRLGSRRARADCNHHLGIATVADAPMSATFAKLFSSVGPRASDFAGHFSASMLVKPLIAAQDEFSRVPSSLSFF
jgi:hypothetical protein